MIKKRPSYFSEPSKKEKVIKQFIGDVIIYGSTPAGIAAAIHLAEKGRKVIIAEFSDYHIGGMTSSGLGATDFGAEKAVGGISREFYKKIGHYYGVSEQTRFEPKVAKKIFQTWLKSYSIAVFFSQQLASVQVEDRKIKSLTMLDETIYSAEIFIDASYEGDLLAKAGVSYNIGREDNSRYHEIYNGIQFGSPHHKFEEWIDPYVVEGNPNSGLLCGIENQSVEELGFNGKGDKRIQAYNFRICLTDFKENKIDFFCPDGYDPNHYLLLLRYLKKGHWDALKLNTLLPNGKSDLNNHGAFSTDFIGENYVWPESDYFTREKIYQAHYTYDLGLLFFLTNDPRVPDFIQKEVSKWGLPKDEFTESNHWPPQLYIREARRMISDYVMTDRNCLGIEKVADSVGLASYHMDSHNCRRVIIDGRVVNEGDVEIPAKPFPISYRSLVPKKKEITNLIVPVCLSSSHIAYGSIRMEPVFMILGQSAGIIADLAMAKKIAVQDISYEELEKELVNAGQIIVWDDSISDDPTLRMQKTF